MPTTSLDTPISDTDTDARESRPRILLVIGHPHANSLGHALANAYSEAAVAGGAEVRVHDLAELRIPHTSDRTQLRAMDGDTSALDPTVQQLIADLRWAQHVVIEFPMWWGTYPAVLKEYLDRVFLSGVAYRYSRTSLAHRLLKGRTARILMTADGPSWWNALVYQNAAEVSLSRAVFGYSGVRMRGISRFPMVRFSTPERRAGWLRKAARLGARDARMRVPVARNS